MQVINGRLNERLSFKKGLLWFAFSGTAMLSAFLLPIHIFALAQDFTIQRSHFFARVYIFVIIFCALYHSLYRVQTIIRDLGFEKITKFTGWLLTLIFLSCVGIALYVL